MAQAIEKRCRARATSLKEMRSAFLHVYSLSTSLSLFKMYSTCVRVCEYAKRERETKNGYIYLKRFQFSTWLINTIHDAEPLLLALPVSTTNATTTLRRSNKRDAPSKKLRTLLRRTDRQQELLRNVKVERWQNGVLERA